MAKNTNRRTPRAPKNNKNVERATAIMLFGFLAEFYLLLINTFFVKGTPQQLVATADFLSVMVYVGAAMVAAGVAMLFLRRKNGGKRSSAQWYLLICGVFFTLSSEVMVKIYPQGVTAMCIFVPAVVVLGVIFLMYQREFSAEAIALSGAIAAMILLNRGAGSTAWAGIVKAAAIAAVCVIAVMIALTARAQKKNGFLCGELCVYPASTNYTMVYAVLAVCAAAILVALFVSGAAYYGIWVMSILAFVLAVYYTVKMM